MVATVTTTINDRRIGGADGATPRRTLPPPREEHPPKEWPVWALRMRQDYEGRIARLERQIAEMEDELMHTRTAARDLREAQFQAQNALAVYGDTNALSEIKQRVALHPTFAGLSEQGRALVAQVAHAMGVNPFMHLHCWMQGNKLQITLDYKGLLYLAGQDNIMESTRLLTRDELLARGVNEKDIDRGAIGAVCEVTEIDKAARCKTAGIEYRPVSGYAVWLPDKAAPNGRDGAWVAEKNALRAALYKVSDLGLKLARRIEGVHESDDGWSAELPDRTPEPDIIDGAYTETPEPPTAAEPTPPETDSPPVGSEPKKCVRCHERTATGEGPYPDHCALCATKTANELASKES